MKVLLVIAVPHALEPVGAMSLCAICKKAGHEVDLAILKQEEGDLSRKLRHITKRADNERQNVRHEVPKLFIHGQQSRQFSDWCGDD